MTETAREIADGIMATLLESENGVSGHDVRDSIEAAILAAERRGIERAAKVAADYNYSGDIVASILALLLPSPPKATE